MSAPNSGRRQQELQAILHQFPGNDCATQRQRMLTAMQRTGGVTTFEAMRYLDCFDPRPRIHELRHQGGYTIKTHMRAEEAESGVLHRVGLYMLEA